MLSLTFLKIQCSLFYIEKVQKSIFPERKIVVVLDFEVDIFLNTHLGLNASDRAYFPAVHNCPHSNPPQKADFAEIRFST